MNRMNNLIEKKTNQRNVNVELIRILACWIVIGVHSKLPDSPDGVLSRGRLLISCFLGDGVAVFWMISGFFIFNKGIERQVKKLIKSIVFPAFLIVCIWQVFGNWFMGQTSLLECIRVHHFNTKEVFGNILSWYAGMTGGGHLWYVFSYVQNFLWVPLLNFVCNQTDSAKKVRRYLIALSFLCVLINDVQLFWALPVGRIVTYSVIGTSVMQMLIGYELYIRKEFFVGKKALVAAGIGIFLICNVIRCFLQYRLYGLDLNNSSLLFWSTGFGTLCSAAIVVVGLSLDLRMMNEKIQRLISRLGSMTFGIYLIHSAVIIKLNSFGVGAVLERIYQCGTSGFVGAALYTVTWILIVFVLSVFIICIIRFGRGIIKKMFDMFGRMLN